MTPPQTTSAYACAPEGADAARPPAGRTAVRPRDAAFGRQFWLLTSGSVVRLIALYMVVPFQVLAVTSGLGVSTGTTGLIMGLAILASLPVQLLGGAAIDRFGRVPALVVSVLGGLALYEGLAYAGSLWQVAAVVFIEAAVGQSLFFTAQNAMTADLVAPRHRAAGYGIGRVALYAALVVGPLLTGWLLGNGLSLRGTFALAGLVSLGFVPFLVALRETRPPGAAHASSHLRQTLRGYAAVLADRRFLKLALVTMLSLYSFAQLFNVYPALLRLQLGIGPATWSWLVAAFAATAAVLQYPAVRRFEARSARLGLAAGAALLGAGLGGAALLPAGPATVAMLVVAAVGVVLVIPLAQTAVSDLAPASLRGRYMGAFSFVYVGGFALGPAIGGLVIDRFGGTLAAVLLVVTGIVAACLYLWVAPRGPAAAADEATTAELEALINRELAGVPAASPQEETG
jgi:MFS family permease